MKKIIPLVLVGMIVLGNATTAFAKGFDKISNPTKIVRCISIDPDFPEPK